MAEEKIRLGGMALPNGVLVHGPNAWGCAVRLRDGRLKVESGSKRLRSASIDNPLLRGPAKIAEVFALLPEIRRKLPEAKLPFERPRVLATMLGSAVAVRVVRGSPRIAPAAQELVSGLLSVAPAALALRGSDLAGYHGAEHISIGTYEHDEPREREHERCGSHMLGPLLLTTGLANAAASRIAGPLRGTARVAASLGGLIASTEIFSWMVQNPEHPVARALARPGHALQHRLATAEPTPGQLEVADAALRACLALENGSANQS
jgi:uncharacterized protein YqhQ